jgi:hypothetical protein
MEALIFKPVMEKSDITTACFNEKPKMNMDVGMNRIPPPIPTIEDIIPINTPKIKASITNSSPSGNVFKIRR